MSVEQGTSGKAGIARALSSLWSTSSEKDETCVKWGLVGRHYSDGLH